MIANGTTQAPINHQPIACRGVRGATTVQHNDPDEILRATRELLNSILKANDMNPEDIASIYFTTTADLNAVYPAAAARQLGWQDAALMCAHEMEVPDGLTHCIRVLIHWNTDRSAKEINHIYLKNARSLRPDRQNQPLVRPRQINQMDAMVRAMQAHL